MTVLWGPYDDATDDYTVFCLLCYFYFLPIEFFGLGETKGAYWGNLELLDFGWLLLVFWLSWWGKGGFEFVKGLFWDVFVIVF